MTATIIALPTRTPRKRRATQPPTKAKIIAEVRRQSEIVYRTGRWDLADDLDMLRYLLKISPNARSISWRGIRFPVRRGVLIDSVRCPETGRGLLGVVG